MKKPATTKTVKNFYGADIRVLAYLTDEQMHYAMKEWADTKEKPPLEIEVVYGDNSSDIEVFERVKKEVNYKVPYQDEFYTVEIDTNKFEVGFLVPLSVEMELYPDGATKKQILILYKEYLTSNTHYLDFKSIKVV